MALRAGKNILVLFVSMALLVPIGLVFWATANTDLMTAEQLAIWNNVPTIVFVGILFIALGMLYVRTRGLLIRIKTKVFRYFDK